MYDKLKNLTMYAMGDSYFYGNRIGTENAWPSLLAKKYEMNYLNDGVGGSTVADYEGYPEQKPPMVLRWDERLPAGDVDIILFEGGRNDHGHRVPIGTNDSTDITTLKGAINVVLDGLQKKFPKALIIFVTPWNVNDSNGYLASTADYAAAIVDLCAERGVACINAADTAVSGVDMNDIAFREQYCLRPTDVSHLNIEGMKLVLPYFEEAIAKIYYAYIGEKI